MTKEELLAAVNEQMKVGGVEAATKVVEAMNSYLIGKFGPYAAVPEIKSVGEQFAASIKGDPRLSLMAKGHGFTAGTNPIAVTLPRYGLKAGEYSAPNVKANVLTTAFPSERTYLPFFQEPRRRLYLRDVLPVAGLGTPQLEYARISAFTNSAGGVAEAAAKPESAITTQLKVEAVKTIATFIPVSRQAIADVNGLSAYLNQVLAYFLALEEDDQILNGTGGNDLNGILADADIITRAVGADTKLDAIRKAITDMQTGFASGTAGFEPTALILHPADWEDLELLKDTTGRYLLIPSDETPAQGGPVPPRVWRVPVIPTPAIAAGTGLMGAFDIAATLWSYEDVTLRVSDSHSDFFVKNLLAILAEFRELLAIYYPKGFVKITGL